MSATPLIRTLEDSIRSILTAFVNPTPPAAWPIVWANQNAPRPGEKYLLLSRLNFGRVGRDFVGKVNPATLNAPTLGTREFTVSINGFGPGSEQVLEDIRVYLDTDAATEALHSAGLAVIESGDVLDLPKLYGQQFQDRSTMDVFFRAHAYSADAEKDLGYIGGVDLELKTIDEAGQESTDHVIIETE